MAFTLNSIKTNEKIILTSTQQCIDVLNHNTADDKGYCYYIVARYLQDNFDSVTEKELDTLLSKTELIEKFNIFFAIKLFKKAILDDKPVSNFHQRWFKLTKIDKSKNRTMLVEYLNLLDKHNNKEQMELLFLENQNLVEEYYKTKTYKSKNLHQIVLNKIPSYIIYNKDFTETELIDWMKKNVSKLKNINTIFSQYSGKLKQELYKILIDFYQNKGNDFLSLKELNIEELSIEQTHHLDNFRDLPTDFFELFKKIDSDLLQKLFSIKVKFLEMDSYENNQQNKVNFYQYLILHNPNCDANFLLIDKDLGFEKISRRLNLYEKEGVDLVEYCYEDLNNVFFTKLGAILENLDKKHQKITIAFELNNSLIRGSLSSCLLNCDMTIFKEYLEMITQQKIAPNLQAEINSLLLKNELEASLSTKSLTTKKRKM